jgi:putative NADH-flavin reductase
MLPENLAEKSTTYDDDSNMLVLIIGATGPTGRELAVRALEDGHYVRLLVRHPDRVSIWSPRLEVVQGDVCEWKDIGPAMRNVNAVLSALGTGTDLKPTTVFSDGAAAILWGMAEAGVKRLVSITSGGTIDDPNEPFFFRKIGRRLLRHIFADQRKAEERIRASEAEWTIVRPARLLDGPARGRYEVASEKPAGEKYEITRADLADFMVREMSAKKYVQQAVGIGYL